MKKLFWLIIITLFIGLLAVGCQATDEGDMAEEDSNTEVVTISIWDFGGSEFAWLDDIAIPEFEASHPNIKIKHVGVIEDELGLKIETAVAAQDVPDLALFVPTRVIATGHVLPLDDYMARDGISRSDYCNLFTAANVANYGKVEDKVVSLPIDSNIWAMVYNKDLFAEAGLPELGVDDYITYDTWLKYARAINKPADTLEERTWGSSMFEPGFNAANNYMSDPFILGEDGRTCRGIADNDDWMHTWNIMMTAFDEDLTMISGGAMVQDLEEDMFVQGKMGMTYATLGDAVYAQSQGLNVALTGQPVVTDGWKGNVGGWNNSYSIMAGSEHPDEAWEFLKYLSTEAPLSVPLGSDMMLSDVSGMPGLPCYLPLHEQGRIAELIAEDPLVADSVALMTHIESPPFTPDTWTSLDGFWEVFTNVDEGGMTLEEAIDEATTICQDATDELWDTFDNLGD